MQSNSRLNDGRLIGANNSRLNRSRLNDGRLNDSGLNISRLNTSPRHKTNY